MLHNYIITNQSVRANKKQVTKLSNRSQQAWRSRLCSEHDTYDSNCTSSILSTQEWQATNHEQCYGIAKLAGYIET